MCPRCADEVILAAKIAEDRRFTRANVLRALRSPRTGVLLILIFVLLLLIVGASVVFINLSSAPVPYETIRRARVGFTQDFSLDGQGIDMAESVNGGGAWTDSRATRPLVLEGDETATGLADQLRVKVGDITELNGVAGDHQFRRGETVIVPLSDWHTSARIVDGLFEERLPGWRSGGMPTYPLEIVLWSQNEFELGKVVIWNHPLEPPESFIDEFEIYSSPVDPRVDRRQLELLGEFSSPRAIGAAVHLLDDSFPEARWYLLRINSNHGLADYLTAAEIGIFAPAPEPPAGTATP